MKNIFIIFILITGLSTNAQVQIGKIETNKGEIIKLYNKKYKNGKVYGVSFGGQFIYFYDINGKNKKFKESKVKKIDLGEDRYITLPISNLIKKRLHTVIAENNRYILTSYFFNGFYIYVYDKMKLKHVIKKEKFSYRKKRDFKVLDKISTYFDRCDIIKKLEIEINNYNYYATYDKGNYLPHVFNNIKNYQCN